MSLLFLFVFFSACTSKQDSSLMIYKTLDESLVISNKVLTNNSATIYASLEEKLRNPVFQERALIWYPRAMRIKHLSDSITAYIDGLKEELKKEAGLLNNDIERSYRKEDKQAVTQILITSGKGKELYSRLNRYKEAVLNIDPLLRSNFAKTILITTSAFDSPENKGDFTRTYFNNIHVAAALSMLSTFQNKIKVTENKAAAFCNETSCRIGFICEFYSPLVGQSSSYVRAGESIEITAGVATFSPAAKPEIIINGHIVPVSSQGVAVYKLSSSKKAGKHVIPVDISYTDQDGRKQSSTFKVNYTVAKESSQDQ
jgi:gliding motility-associated protein GldM